MNADTIDSPLRVGLMQGASSGPILGIALDSQKENDAITTLGDIKVVIDNTLLLQCGDVTVDFVEEGNRAGFNITSTNPLPGGSHDGAIKSCGSGRCDC